MKTFSQFVFLSLCLLFFNCNNSTEKGKTTTENGKVDVEYQAFLKYLKSKNLSLCQLKEIRKQIIENAESLADKKYPNSIAQHDKYIERITEREIDTILEKYNLKTQDWSEARIYADKYCK